ARGVKQEVRVLDPFGNTLVGKQIADGVAFQERAELHLGNVGIDGHQADPLTKAMSAGVSSTSLKARMTGNSSVSVAVTASWTETSKRARKASMISSTRISGADAPAERPSVE